MHITLGQTYVYIDRQYLGYIDVHLCMRLLSYGLSVGVSVHLVIRLFVNCQGVACRRTYPDFHFLFIK